MTIDFKALYPKLINLLLDTVFVVDEFGQIVFVSDACEQLLGYSASEMTDTRILNYIHPDDLDRTLAAARSVMSGQSHTDFENRYLHKNGSVVHILWSARWSEQDRLRIAVARDVTALGQADQTRNALLMSSARGRLCWLPVTPFARGWGANGRKNVCGSWLTTMR